jgi:GT2 family glycosyltransferase
LIKNSIIVCTKDRTNDLSRLIYSLSKQTLLPDELIIIDASKNDNTHKMLKNNQYRKFFDIVYKKSEANLTKQRNIGVNLVCGKYLFFFDDDIVLERNFVETVYNTFEKFEGSRIAGITGKIINIKSSAKSWDQLFKKLFLLSDIGKGSVKLSGLPSIRIDNKLSLVESMPGGCSAYKENVFRDFKFDENLSGYAYLEDVDFSYRVAQKYKLLYQPEAKLSHFPTTYLLADKRDLKKQFIQNQTYLFKKNMPKDIKHYSGFYTSLIGNLLYNGIIERDLKACLGIIEGLLNPLKC